MNYLKLPGFQIGDPNFSKQIVFRLVEFETDVNRLYEWMHQPHVIPFWKLNISVEQYRDHLQKFLADHHQTLFIGELDGLPMSYWEAYWVKGDILANYYDYQEADQGIHLLIGPTTFLGKGYALTLLRLLVNHLFQHQETKKVVAEPDIRNKKMIHVFEKCGFVMQKEIQLPDKRAALMFCERESFEFLVYR